MELVLAYGLLVLGLIVLLGSLDDIAIDVLKWWHGGSAKAKSLPEGALDALSEAPSIAVFVANWREADVLGPMVQRNLANFTYERVTFVLGVYPNDTETCAVAMGLAERYPGKVEVVVNRSPGPTSKGQMLNEMFDRVFAPNRVSPDLVVMHDSEDIICPRSFEVYALESRSHAMIQIPIFSLDSRDRSLVAATYMEEFAERHTGEMLLRERLGSFVPSAGVGTCLRKDLIQHFIAKRGHVLQPGSVTEDYVLGAEAYQAGFSTAFAAYRDLQQPSTPLIATLEYFPKDFWASLRQRTRWTYGIGFEGFKRLGWFGSGWNRFFLYRDRKGAVANFLPLVSLILLAACLLVSPDFSTFPTWQRNLLIAILAFNSLVIALRVYQKSAALKNVYGGYDVLGLLARWPIALLINAMAASRAWRSFIVESGLASRPIAWAKTQHELPASFQVLGARAVPVLAGRGSPTRRRLTFGSSLGGAAALACLLLLVAGGLRVLEPLMSPVTEQVAEVVNPQAIDSEERRIVEQAKLSAVLTNTGGKAGTVEHLDQNSIETAAQRAQDAGDRDIIAVESSARLATTLTALAEFSISQGAREDAGLLADARPAVLGDVVALLNERDTDETPVAATEESTSDSEAAGQQVARVWETRNEVLFLAEAGISAGRQMDIVLLAQSSAPAPDPNAMVQVAEAEVDPVSAPVPILESRDDLIRLTEAGIAARQKEEQEVLAMAIPSITRPPTAPTAAAASSPSRTVGSIAAADNTRADIEQMAPNSSREAATAKAVTSDFAVPEALPSKPKADIGKSRKKVLSAKSADRKALRKVTNRKKLRKKKAPVQVAAPPAIPLTQPTPKKATTFLRRRCQGPDCGSPGFSSVTKELPYLTNPS